MGTRVAKIENERWWVVYQSTAMSTYSPIFYDQLSALMFARLYTSSSRAELLNKDYSDNAQSTLAGFIIMFLNETCPEDRFENRHIPRPWIKEMDPQELEPDFHSAYGYEDLVEAFNANYECTAADVVMREFGAWRVKNGYGTLPQRPEAIHA